MKHSESIFLLFCTYFVVLSSQSAIVSTLKPSTQPATVAPVKSTSVNLLHQIAKWHLNLTTIVDKHRCKYPPCYSPKFPFPWNFTRPRPIRPKTQNIDVDIFFKRRSSPRIHTTQRALSDRGKNSLRNQFDIERDFETITFPFREKFDYVDCWVDLNCESRWSGTAICREGKCECLQGMKKDYKSKKCLATDSDLGKTCQYNWQCLHNTCRNGKCRIPDTGTQNTEKFAMGFGIAVVGLLVAISVCGCAKNRRRNYSHSTTTSSRTDSRLNGDGGTSSTLQLLAGLNDVPPGYSDVYLIGPQSRVPPDVKPPSYEDALREASWQSARLIATDQSVNPSQQPPSSVEANSLTNSMNRDNLHIANESSYRALSPSGELVVNNNRANSEDRAENSSRETPNHAGQDDITLV